MMQEGVRPRGANAHRLLAKPLPARAVIGATSGVLAAGSVYCVLHELAQQSGAPVASSITWAAAMLVPWYPAFEANKRMLSTRAPLKTILPLLGSVCALAMLFSILAESLGSTLIFGLEPRALGSQIVDRLPILALLGLLAIVSALLNARAPEEWDGVSDNEQKSAEDGRFASLGACADLALVRAAGNYAEFHLRDHIVTRRMTMAEAEAFLDPACFVRIHRSVIVNSNHVVRFTGRAVQISDGRVLSVGHAYRHRMSALSRRSPLAA